MDKPAAIKPVILSRKYPATAWLSATEALPELEAHPLMWSASRPVLVTSTDSPEGQCIATLEANELGGAAWISRDGYMVAGVTHWRDLPALPVRQRHAAPATDAYEVAP